MNNILEYKGYYGIVNFSSTSNILYGNVIGVNGMISYEGESIKELKQDFEEAIEDYLEMCKEKGIEPEKSYRGSFNVRISPDLHKSLVIYAASHEQSLNTTVEEAIKKYVLQ